MTPLDLTKAPPRSPRVELWGLCMLPRMIDIARAMLPGGVPGEYRIGRDKTLSAIVLRAFGMSPAELVDVVRDANTDEEIAERIWDSATVPPKALSARLRRITVKDVPTDLLPTFQRLYGAQNADVSVFSILEADDVRTFAAKA